MTRNGPNLGMTSAVSDESLRDIAEVATKCKTCNGKGYEYPSLYLAGRWVSWSCPDCKPREVKG